MSINTKSKSDQLKKSTPSRPILCTKCGEERRTCLVNRNICYECQRKEISKICTRCKVKRHLVEGNPPVCPRCASINARPKVECRGCKKVVIIFDCHSTLCKKCYDNRQQRLKNQVKRIKRPCTECGEIRVSALIGRMICTTCYMLERHGEHVCSGCGKEKLILIKSKSICKRCYENQRAEESLRKLIANYVTPFTYNQTLFDLFAGAIDWHVVDEKILQKVKAFAKFLQRRQLPEPLTWGIIKNLLPCLASSNRTTPKFIRSCLYDVGHLLAASASLETLEAYSDRYCSLRPISRAPEILHECLFNYAAWLEKQLRRPKTVRNHLGTVVDFAVHCDQNGVKFPDDVHPAFVANYLSSLRWQWHCVSCQKLIFDPYSNQPPKSCLYCITSEASVKTNNHSHHSVRVSGGHLKVFFDWVESKSKSLCNPV